MDNAGELVMSLGKLVSLVGGIWLIVKMFQTSIGWGIAGLLCCPTWLAWLPGNWIEGKKPFAVYLVGAAIQGLALTMGASSPLDQFGFGRDRDSTEFSEMMREAAREAEKEDSQTPRDEGLAQAQNSAAATNAAMQDGMATPAPEPQPAPGTAPGPGAQAMMPPGAAAPMPGAAPGPGTVLTPAVAPAVGPTPATVPAPAAPLPPGATPTPGPAPTPPPVVVDGLPVGPLWQRYFEAAQMIEQGNPAGVDALNALVSADDVAWFDKNAVTIAAILIPNSDTGDPAKARLVAAKALLRSMPPRSDEGEPFSRTFHAVGAGKVTARRPDGTLASYTTPIVQENGRWVIARYFFARDFVWTPQIATHKRAKNIPLGPDEQEFLTAGFGPMQGRAQSVLGSVGMGGK
jgi:hypothetical protein